MGRRVNRRLPLRLPLDLVMTSVGSVVISSRSSSRRMYLRTVFSLMPTACPIVLMLGQHWWVRRFSHRFRKL